MKLCATHIVQDQYNVKLEQHKNGRFRVTYGKQVRSQLTYAEAAKEFGECVFHQLACAGQLDNERTE